MFFLQNALVLSDEKKIIYMNLKLQKLSKVSVAFLMTLLSVWSWGQGTLSSPIFSENFGTLADGTNLTTTNTAFTYVRVGTSTGAASINNEIVAKNPSTFTGSSAFIGAKGGSVSTVDKTGLTSFNSGTYTFKFRTPSSLTSAIMFSAVGSGASFASNGGFTGSQLSAAFQVNGTSLQIRTGGGWTPVQTVAASTNYTVAIVFNNTAGNLTYGDGNSLPANRTDIWVNGTKVSTQYVAATNSLSATAFRIYTTTTEFEIDDIAVYNTLPTASSPTWDGTQWVGGVTPTNATPAIINGNYSGAGFTAQSVTVNSTFTLTINSGETVTTGNLANNGAVIVNDGGNLIQTATGLYSGSGTFTVNKSGASAPSKYAFWSSPVASQDLTSIYGVGNTPSFITEYNTTTDYFVNAASTTSVLGKGYSIKTPAVANVSFAGTPNNGAQTYTLATAGSGHNLVGNPYPSNLNLAAFYTLNSGRITNTFYFWDNTSNSVTTQGGTTSVNIGYATYNALTQVWAPAPNIVPVPTGNVANIGQGFFVQTVTTPTDTSLGFNNDMRVATTGTFFNKNNSSTEGKFWLRINSSYNTNNTFVVAYLSPASDAYDNYDSKAIATGSDAFYTIADAQKLLIQGKAAFDTDDVVPVGTKHFENGNFVITLAQKEGIFNNGQAIYLHDKVTGTYTNLQNGTYSFTANSGEVTNRFEIVYKLDVLGTSEVTKNAFEVYKEGEDFYVRNDKNIETVEVFDAAGRKVMQINANSKLVRVKLDAKGLYILKAVSQGKEYSKKLIK